MNLYLKKIGFISLIGLIWYSTNPSVLSINPETGIIKRVGQGTTQICVQYGEIKNCVSVVVN